MNPIQDHNLNKGLLILPDDVLLSISHKYLSLFTSIQLASVSRETRRILAPVTTYIFILEKSSRLSISWELMYETIRPNSEHINGTTIWALFMRLMSEIDIAIRYPCFMTKVLGKIAMYSIIGSTDIRLKNQKIIQKYVKLLQNKGFRLLCIYDGNTERVSHIHTQFINASNCMNEEPCICHGFDCHKSWSVFLDVRDHDHV